MNAKRSYDAVIVGGGIIGLSCAWSAVRRGARVALIDRAQPATGTTRVAAGMLAPIGELAFGEPELLRLNVAAAELYPDFVAELDRAVDWNAEAAYTRCGALHVALDRDEAAQLRRVHDLQRSLGLEAEWLPPRRCRDLEPGLTPSFAGGVHAPREAAVDPRMLAEALQEACGKERFRYSITRSEGLLFDGDRVAGVRTKGGREWRGTVVLAAGAWSGSLAWLPQDARPPVRPVKGQILTLRTRDGSAPCERIVASERVYLVPRADGRLLVGATVEEQGFDTTVTAGGVHELLREAYRLMPDVAEMELVEQSAGLRPGTPDNLPLIGPSGTEGLIWATGHYRNGILLAPLTGYAVAELLDTGRLPEPVAAADPARLGAAVVGASA